MECFLCERGNCFLISKNGYNIYSSLFPDLDGDCEKPLHVLVAPEKHYESISEMSDAEFSEFALLVRKVQEFYLKRGYGPAVTELRLQPGPHTPHVHVHLVFSSSPLAPLKKGERRPEVDNDFLSKLKEESFFFI